MVAIKRTNTTIPESNYAANSSKILISRKGAPENNWIDWKKYHETVWVEYQIKETDFRIKTATFTSPEYLDLTTGTYCVLFTSPMHEDFTGIILNVEYDHKTGLYKYQCQDWSRVYQSKFELISRNTTIHRILQFLISRGKVSTNGKLSNSKANQYKKTLSGLRPAYQYEQSYYDSSIKSFNPMTMKPNMILRNKSFIEAIRDLVYSTGAYIDVHFDKYGVIQVEPYTKDDFYNTGLLLTSTEISGLTQKFDTTNIITSVGVYSTDKMKGASVYGASGLIDINLSSIFGNLSTFIDNPLKQSTTTNKTSNKTTSPSKKSNTANKTSNPYNTKKKIVYINSDNINGKASDTQFMRDVAKLLRKQGWTTKIIGLGPNTHTEGYMNGCKNGVWFCIYGGADAAVFRETGTKNSYTNKLKSLNSRTVIGMHGGGNIRKGGKYYKWLPRAHDDNYSPSSFRGIEYPLDFLTKHKVPIMYASTAKQMVAKFLAGGDNPEAC